MQSLQQLLNDWRSSRQQMEQTVKNMPRIIGVESVKIIKENFRLHGYDSGNGFVAWKKRKEATNKAYEAGRGKGKQGTYKGSVFSSGKPLLLQTLRLFNSIQYKAGGKSVRVGVDLGLVPYAKAHNEGLNHEPVRQYMPKKSEGANQKMVKAYERVYNKARDKALAKFKK